MSTTFCDDSFASTLFSCLRRSHATVLIVFGRLISLLSHQRDVIFISEQVNKKLAVLELPGGPFPRPWLFVMVLLAGCTPRSLFILVNVCVDWCPCARRCPGKRSRKCWPSYNDQEGELLLWFSTSPGNHKWLWKRHSHRKGICPFPQFFGEFFYDFFGTFSPSS